MSKVAKDLERVRGVLRDLLGAIDAAIEQEVFDIGAWDDAEELFWAPLEAAQKEFDNESDAAKP